MCIWVKLVPLVSIWNNITGGLNSTDKTKDDSLNLIGWKKCLVCPQIKYIYMYTENQYRTPQPIMTQRDHSPGRRTHHDVRVLNHRAREGNGGRVCHQRWDVCQLRPLLPQDWPGGVQVICRLCHTHQLLQLHEKVMERERGGKEVWGRKRASYHSCQPVA